MVFKKSVKLSFTIHLSIIFSQIQSYNQVDENNSNHKSIKYNFDLNKVHASSYYHNNNVIIEVIKELKTTINSIKIIWTASKTLKEFKKLDTNTSYRLKEGGKKIKIELS